MKTNNLIITVLIIVVLILGFSFMKSKTDVITNTDVDIVDVTPNPNATTTSQTIGDITLEKPEKGTLVESPIHIEGKAPGTWFFEAVIGVHVEDDMGNKLTNGHGEAVGEWMTTELVNFKADLIFAAPKTKTGFIVISKDNPSGLPENDKSVRFPITFK